MRPVGAALVHVDRGRDGRTCGNQQAPLVTVRTRLDKSIISHIFCFQVSAIYKDPSLDSNLRLVIVRMIFFEDEQEGLVDALRK